MPDPLPLVARGGCALRLVDAGGAFNLGHFTSSRTASKPALCCYSLHQFVAERVEVIDVDDGLSEISDGPAVVLLPPGRDHRLTLTGLNDARWVHLLVQPEPDWPDAAFRRDFHLDRPGRATFLQPDALTTWGVDLPRLVPADLLAPAVAAMVGAVRAWRCQAPQALVAAHLSLSALFDAWVGQAMRPAAEADLADADRLELAMAQAQTGLATGISVRTLAAGLGMERSVFTRWFQRLAGLPPGTWLAALRLHRAARLLRVRPDLSIAMVAHHSGFADAAAFGRAFRRFCGVTPGMFRRRRSDPGLINRIHRLASRVDFTRRGEESPP